jgi:hypothetical protein
MYFDAIITYVHIYKVEWTLSSTSVQNQLGT